MMHVTTLISNFKPITKTHADTHITPPLPPHDSCTALQTQPPATHTHTQTRPCIILPKAPAVVYRGNSLISWTTKDHIPTLSFLLCLHLPLDPVLIPPVKHATKLLFLLTLKPDHPSYILSICINTYMLCTHSTFTVCNWMNTT